MKEINPSRFHVRADWYDKTMKFLLKNSNKGLVVLNNFAQRDLKIDPADVPSGVEFDAFLQGLEDRQLIFYKVKELAEGGKLKENRCLNTVEFSAILQNEGWQLMQEIGNAQSIKNLNRIALLIALVSLITSLGSLIVQAKDNTDEQLEQLNKQLPRFQQLLQDQGKSQQRIDETLRQIRDSL